LGISVLWGAWCQPFYLAVVVSDGGFGFSHCNDPLQHAAFRPIAWQRFGGHERGVIAVHNGRLRGRLARAIEHTCSLRAQWLCCSLSYSEPASDRACMRCTHTTCPAVLHFLTAGSVGWNPSHIQPFILRCWIQGELSFYAHCNDPLQHSALSPTAWQRFRGDQWGQWRYTTGRLQGAICAGDWPACSTPYVAQSCAAHGCFSLVRQRRPTPQRPGDIVRITRRAQRANSAPGTAA